MMRTEEKIRDEQTLLLFRAVPLSVGGTFLGIGFLLLLMWPAIPHQHLLIWAALLGMVTLARLAHALAFLRSTEPQRHRRNWAGEFSVLAIAAALAWASVSLFLFPASGTVHQMMLAFILATVCAVAITNISAVRHVAISFIVIAMAPLAARFFLSAMDTSIVTGAMVSLALVLFVMGAIRANGAIVENIRYRLEAVDREQQLRESQQRLALHIRNTPLAVIEWSPEMEILDWNQAAENIFGYRREEALGRNANDLIVPPADREHVGKIITRLNRNEGGFYSINENVTRNGDLILCEWFNTPLIDDKGKVIGLASLAHDVTDRTRVDRLKKEFVSTVSHELRTPLTSLRGSLGLLLGDVGGALPDATRELLGLAERNAVRLQHLVNDLLDMQQIEDGKVEYHFREIGLFSLIERSLSENAGYARQKLVELKIIDDTDGRPASVMADKNRLLQVMDNLISNAIKFSPEHSEVSITLAHHRNRARISICDQGKGIPRDAQSLIFEKFTQLDASDTRDFAGTGLGLSIAKSIVEQHRGQIGYESAPGGGACFYFELPLATDRKDSGA